MARTKKRLRNLRYIPTNMAVKSTPETALLKTIFFFLFLEKNTPLFIWTAVSQVFIKPWLNAYLAFIDRNTSSGIYGIYAFIHTNT